VRVTPSPAAKDAIDIQGAEVEGDTLRVRAAHGGGCRQHTYELQWNGAFEKSEAGVAKAELVLHDAHGDACEAFLSVQPTFDLTPLKQRWREQQRGEHGVVELRLAGSQATARYAF
jgi:hypothetical protein